MWSEQLKSVIVKLKNDNELREKFLFNQEVVDLSFLTKEEKRAVIEVFSNRQLATDLGPMGFWM